MEVWRDFSSSSTGSTLIAVCSTDFRRMSRAAFLYKKTVRDSSKAFGVRRLFSSDVSVEVKIAVCRVFLLRICRYLWGSYLVSYCDHQYRHQSILQLEFQPTFVDVKDVSGGCGAMFNITVESEKFKVSWRLHRRVIFQLTYITICITYCQTGSFISQSAQNGHQSFK